MKLKRKWPGICILVIFIIFDVVMAASSGFFSGLFPSDNKYVYIAAVTAAGVAAASVITLLLGKVCDYIETEVMAQYTGIQILYWLILLAVIAGGVIYRFNILDNSTLTPVGKLSLYENAMVGVFDRPAEYDLLSILYSDILNVILIFTGNKIAVTLYFQIILFTVFIVCGALCCNFLLGNAASVVFAAFLSFMPVFTEITGKLTVGTDELFYALYGIELLLIAIFLRNASDGKYTSRGYVIWYLALGCAVGFMTYLDAGTIIVVLPLLLAGLFILQDQGFEGLFRLVFVLLGALVVFFIMIAQEEGIGRVDAVFLKWSAYYFHNLNTFSMFWTYTNYKLVYLIVLLVMSGLLLGYFRNRRYENITPWLLSTMIVFFGTPFFGATRMNDQVVVTIYFGFVLACLASLIVTQAAGKETKEAAELTTIPVDTGIREVVNPADGFRKKSLNENMEEPTEEFTEEPIEELANESEKESLEKESSEKESSEKETESEPVQKEEAAPAVESDDSEEYYDEEDEEFAEAGDSREEPSQKQEPESKPQADKTQADKTQSDKPRYVPDGMVLPAGSEDEMEVELSKIKMPKFYGKIGLDRKSKQTDIPPVKKDDFDLPMKPGDDFDL